MNKYIEYMLLFFIIIFASALRLWQLGDVPSSPDWDEVALGYNAYSIMQTGRDEYGEFLPIILRSFDDYKPALYAYLIVPFIKIFDLTVFAVRLPSAIFGILTIVATYFLLKELFVSRESSRISARINTNTLALLSAFLLAISPWHIQFSRIAFESNVGLAFNVFAALFFVLGLRKPWFLIVSAFFMSINLYVYQSEKVFTPLLFIALVTIFRKELFLIPKKYIVAAVMLGIVVSLPIVHYTLVNRGALSRAKDVSILANTTPFLGENVQRLARDRESRDYLGLLFDNRRVMYFKAVVTSYLSHFDLNWLFIKGDNARHHAPNMGLLYIWELPFLIIGIYKLLFGSSADGFTKKVKIFVFSWFLIAPIPASVTSDVPHAVRTLNFLPTFQIFTAIGLLTAFQFINKHKVSSIKYYVFKGMLYTFSLIFITFNILYYLNQYFVQQNYFHAKYWQYGYANIVNHLSAIYKNYNKVIVSNVAPMDQSYMFFLFYLKYDPHKYLSEGGTKSGKLAQNENKFANFEFRKFDYYSENEKNILLVGSSTDFLEVFKTIHEVRFPDGSLAIKIVEKNR